MASGLSPKDQTDGRFINVQRSRLRPQTKELKGWGKEGEGKGVEGEERRSGKLVRFSPHLRSLPIPKSVYKFTPVNKEKYLKLPSSLPIASRL